MKKRSIAKKIYSADKRSATMKMMDKVEFDRRMELVRLDCLAIEDEIVANGGIIPASLGLND